MNQEDIAEIWNKHDKHCKCVICIGKWNDDKQSKRIWSKL